MAQKIKLGARPKSFSRTVTFPMVEGGDGCIDVTYKYRTRKEMAKLADEIQAMAKSLGDSEMEALKAKIEANEAVETPKQVDLLDRDMSAHVDYVMQIVEGWNLDEKFCRAAVEQLADEVPAAVKSIIEAYRTAIHEGRQGN